MPFGATVGAQKAARTRKALLLKASVAEREGATFLYEKDQSLIQLPLQIPLALTTAARIMATMSTIAAAVFDVVAALPGRGCSMQDVIKALPDIDREQVTSAIHRLSEKGVLMARHDRLGFTYSIAPGATRPTDGRGRPRKSEQSTRWLESSPATLRNEASR